MIFLSRLYGSKQMMIISHRRSAARSGLPSIGPAVVGAAWTIEYALGTVRVALKLMPLELLPLSLELGDGESQDSLDLADLAAALSSSRNA